jgi:hypothetical protein
MGYSGILYDNESYRRPEEPFPGHSGATVTGGGYLTNVLFPFKDDVDADPDSFAAWQINGSRHISGSFDDISHSRWWVDYKKNPSGVIRPNAFDADSAGHTFQETVDKTESRFKEIMQAMVAVFPTIKVLVAHGMFESNNNVPVYVSGHTHVTGCHDLVGACIYGLIKGTEQTGAVVVDLGENYKYRTAAHFKNAYQWRKYDMMSVANNTVRSNSEQWEWTVPVSFAGKPNIGFMTHNLATSSPDDEFDTHGSSTPEDIKNATIYALQQTDSIVVYYTEFQNWLDPDASNWVPNDWKDALQDAYDSISSD